MRQKFLPCLLACACTLLVYTKSSAQLTQPYTLSFNSNSTAAWADGIAQDGDGGTPNIAGMDIQIYAASTGTFAVYPGSIMRWANNGYFISGNADFTGITPGPDPVMSNVGVPAMVMKSTNPAFNFSLTNIRLYDWGGTATTRISTYNNGVFVGSIDVTFEQVNWTTRTLTPATGLVPSVFQNIDEIRFTPVGAAAFWLSMNDITVSNLGVLPVTLSSFETALQSNSSVLLKWTTEQEVNTSHFEIEHSVDGISFSSIATINAKGNHSTATDYNFSTGSLSTGKHYYRLKISNADGSFTYSKINVIAITSKKTISIYPNPVKDVAQVYADGDNILQVRLYNAAGALLKAKMVNAKNANVNLTGMSKATYYIDVVTDKKTYREVIFKN